MHGPSKRIMSEEDLLVSAHAGRGRSRAGQASRDTIINAKTAET